MEKTFPFYFQIIHLPGFDNLGGDTTFRNPVDKAENMEDGVIQFTGKVFFRSSYRQLSGEDLIESRMLEIRVMELMEIETEKLQCMEVCATVIDWKELEAETAECEEVKEVAKARKWRLKLYRHWDV